MSTIEGRGLGLHWGAASTVEDGEACIYLTIDDIPDSDDACGDPSAPVLGVHAVDGGTVLFGVLPELGRVDWEIEGTMASGSLMFATERCRGGDYPLRHACSSTEGDLRVQFPDVMGMIVVRLGDGPKPAPIPNGAPTCRTSHPTAPPGRRDRDGSRP